MAPRGCYGGSSHGDTVATGVELSGARIVDTSSGVEDVPGHKNVDKIAEFFALSFNPLNAAFCDSGGFVVYDRVLNLNDLKEWRSSHAHNSKPTPIEVAPMKRDIFGIFAAAMSPKP